MSVADYMKRIIKQKSHIKPHPEGKLSGFCLPATFEGCSVEGEQGLFGLINKDSNQTLSPIVLPFH